MADNEASLRQTLDFFLAERAKKIEDVKRLDLTISQIKQSLGEPADNPAELVEMSSSLATPAQMVQQQRNGSGRLTVRADEFFGLQYSDAARNYLRKVGHAVGLDELLEALRAGGCKVGGSDPKRVLYISLVRNTRDFVPTGNSNIGLREFYPNLPKAKSIAATKKAHKGKKKSKKLTKTKSTATTRPEPVKSQTVVGDASKLRETVDAVMKSGEFMDAKEIFRNVQGRMQGKIAPISIYGMLRTKGHFERNTEGKYRAVAQ